MRLIKKLSFLEYFDIFGHQFNFTIGNSPILKTKAGGAITLLFALSLIIPCWYFGRDIQYHEEPNFFSEKEMLNIYPNQNINNSNFFFAYRIINYDFQTINDPRNFEFTFEYEEYINKDGRRFEQYNKTDFPIDCNLKHVNNDSVAYTTENLQDFKCLDLNYSMGGDWTQGNIKLPNFMIRRCNNETEQRLNIKCSTDDEVRAIFKTGIFVSFYVHKNYIISSNFENPISPKYIHYYFTLDLDNILLPYAQRQKFFLIFNESELKNDAGFF